MMLRESIAKTKNFFRKTLLNLKSLLFRKYQKLQKTPLLGRFCKSRNRQADQYFADFCKEWESDLEEAKKRKNDSVIASKEPVDEEDVCGRSLEEFAKQNPLKNKHEGGMMEEKKGSFHIEKREDQCPRDMNADGYALAQKMKQLDMLDAGDVEHVLDIEEAIHYYSRLKSPVYLDIVDKFFMDMYSEFCVPQAPARINSSKLRLGSIRL